MEERSSQRLRAGARCSRLLGPFIQMYREEASYGVRSSKWVRKVGIDRLKKSIVESREGREELVERLNCALKGKRDPWARAQKSEGEVLS